MRRAAAVAWGVAGVGLALSALGAVVSPGAFAHAWLAGAVLFSGWPLGSLGLVLAHALTGGRWGEALGPALRVGVAATPLVAVLWVPVVLGFGALYPWAGHAVANGWYLNTDGAAFRGVAYLVVWLGLAAAVRFGVHRAVAAPGLVLLGVSVNFATIDATLSLEPTFNSAEWGMIGAAGMALLALAVATAMGGPALPGRVRADCAKLMLAGLCLWQYLDFMQFLIVWQSNLPSEAAWLAPRLYGGWGIVAGLVVLDHFLLPFAILLLPGLQRREGAVLGAAGLIVLGAVLRSWWVVVPAGHRGLGWVDAAVMTGVLGLGAAVSLTWGERVVQTSGRRAVHA